MSKKEEYTEKTFVIRFKDKTYLQDTNEKTYKKCYMVEAAKRFYKDDSNIKGLEEHDIVGYDEELYAVMKSRFEIYVNGLLEIDKTEYKREDLLEFCQTYEAKPDNEGKYTAYFDLYKDYKDSLLLKEICRIGMLHHYQEIALDYCSLKALKEDAKYCKKNNINVNLTEEYKAEYEKALEMLDKYYTSYDYRIYEQYNLLEEAFKDKYITKEIYKEFYEDYYEEDMEDAENE